jgi:omega-6 fatty acid desaturase (delta-12 desaturase)
LVIFYVPLVLFYFVASYTFYAQHQFEETYWENDSEWNYQEASFHGATFIAAPKWYCWLTGNVVYHNIHHLMSGIPFYQLPAAAKALGQTIPYRLIPLSEVWGMLSLKVWDEEQKKLVPIPRNKR